MPQFLLNIDKKFLLTKRILDVIVFAILLIVLYVTFCSTGKGLTVSFIQSFKKNDRANQTDNGVGGVVFKFELPAKRWL